MIYCKRCVYPIIAVNLEINEDGICSSCKTFELFNKISSNDWKKREQKFQKIIENVLEKNKNNSKYDCLIPVSGGKDSYYQTHIICKKYNLKPLLVTYDGNNYLPEGEKNRDQMRKVFDADHIIWKPSEKILKKLNILGFEKMGDMNWHAHCGIFTSPIIMSVNFNIPLIIWGEVSWDISGMFEPDDYVEFSKRVRHEHDLRGYEWYDFINESGENSIVEKDMVWAKYPSDEEILKLNLKGIYIGNFFKWDPNKNLRLIKEMYNFDEKKEPFQRTYRLMSNLDDRYENGVHDLLKFIKFGYGRASDHASKDVRDGYFSRAEAVKIVKKYDHVVSDDLYYWLDYVGKDEDYFWRHADTFRSPKVWQIKNKQWCKLDVDGKERYYGDVRMSKENIENFENLKKKK